MASKSTASTSSRRSASRSAGAASSGARGSRRSSGQDEPLIREEELNQLIDEGKALAEQVVGKPRFTAMAGIAPTLLAIVGRYARREPLKAAGLAVVAGGLYLLARALMQEGSMLSTSSPGGGGGAPAPVA